MSMDDGRFVGSILSTLFVFFLVFAALHDISRADQTSYIAEYAALVISGAAFAFIYRKACQVLTFKSKLVWLALTGVLILLFDLAALEARLHPKYPNDWVVGSAFLAVTLPLLGLLGYQLIRHAATKS
jgi:hypothetical protein